MFYIIVILTAVFAMPASADETVKWRHVHHYASNQSQEVPANGHILGVIRLPGIALFPDGSIGTSLVIGTYDFYAGSSTGGGYYTVTFADGSELWTKWTGENKVIVPGKPASKGGGTAIVVGGKGRYEGAKGEGTFETEATGGAPDGIQYVDNVITIKK
jgi:hypothetical protein